jgi:hypothetical protein
MFLFKHEFFPTFAAGFLLTALVLGLPHIAQALGV